MADFDECVKPFINALEKTENCEMFFPEWVYNGDGGIASVYYGFEMGQHCMINCVQSNLIFDDGWAADESFPEGVTGWIRKICDN